LIEGGMVRPERFELPTYAPEDSIHEKSIT
jgi:hypothetical protein